MENSFAKKIIDIFGKQFFEIIWNCDNTIDPWAISWKANKKAIFNCVFGHSYKRMIYTFWKTQECPVCKKRSNSIGVKIPDSIQYWSDLNEHTPFDYSSRSSNSVYWKCNNGKHDDYCRTIKNSVLSNFECPKCHKIKSHPNIFNRLELEGQKFGELMVESFSYVKNGATYWNCLCSCGNHTVKNGNDMKAGKIITCGDRSIHKVGENNSNWRNGATEKNYTERYTKEYLKWHHEVLQRDNYTCQCCGQYSGNLEVHHLNDFASYVSMRTSISNGITLCKNCHNSTISCSFHNTYGTHGKTPEELEEYINSRRKQLGINIPFSLDSYLSGNILKPGDIDDEPEYPWIFDTINYYKSENNYSKITV